MNNTINTKSTSNNSNLLIRTSLPSLRATNSIFRLLGSILFLLIVFINPIYSQTYEEIQRLRAEYEKLQKQEVEGESEIVNPSESDLPTKIIYKPSDIESFYKEQLKRLVTNIKDIEEIGAYLDSNKTLNYFGYDFFNPRDSLQFWQNLPLPTDYKLGAGDELIISLWGEIERVDRKTVNRDGSIFLEDVGIIPISGKTVHEAEKFIRSRFEKTYATLKGNQPKSSINVSLGNLKGLNVHFYGAVNSPGVHALHPFSTVLSGLVQAGGIDTTGSLRKITVYRENTKLEEFDLYDVLTRGRLGKDIKLLDQDIIFVPNRISSISITGEIFRPGIFELKPNESMNTLINYGGGLKPDALQMVTLKRVENINGSQSINHFQVSTDQMDAFIMTSGDSVFVPQLLEFDKNVTISGHVMNPGEYTLIKAMRLKDLLLISGSIQDEIWWESVDHKNSSLSRVNGMGVREASPIHFDKIDDNAFNPLLKPFDHVLVAKNKKYSFGPSATLTGEVRIPGVYNINNNTLNQLITEAGGFTDQAFSDGIEVFRDTLSLAWHHLDFPLVDGDSIHVPIKTNTIKIVGAVNNEGYYPYNKGNSLKEYIDLAGGFTVYANRKDVVVILPNGIARRKTRYSNPKVLEGSTIIVSGNDLVVSQPDYLVIGSQVASIIGSLATVALIINSQK